jgi:DNA mismatch endonuclease (patch repair protein)
MRRQRRADTHPELVIRRLLHRDGYRFRVHMKVPDAPRRTIDIAFPRLLVAVFVDGCYWHGCPEHGTSPVANAEWWASKLAGYRRRDQETDEHLQARGWCPVRIWEHEDPLTAVARVERLLRCRRDGQNASTSAVPEVTSSAEFGPTSA